MKALVAFTLLLASWDAWADCERTHVPPADKPGFDGPGSFGPLQDTVTLGCLTYVGFIEKQGRRIAIVQDETGVAYRVQEGDHVGENFGTVTTIDPDRIEIVQVLKEADGKLVKAAPKYLRRKDK